MVCSVQVHSQRPPQEEAEEEEDSQVSESSSHQEPPETGSSEERPAAEGEVQRVVSGAENEGETLFDSFYCLLCCDFHTLKTLSVLLQAF